MLDQDLVMGEGLDSEIGGLRVGWDGLDCEDGGEGVGLSSGRGNGVGSVSEPVGLSSDGGLGSSLVG